MDVNTQNKKSLIVQGGGQKGAFAAGVLDAFKKKHYDPFSLYIGTSAGALNVAAFVAGQTGLGLDFILNYTTNKRFFELNKFMTKERPMDLDWAFQLVESGEFPLDIEKGKRILGEDKQALACMTNVEEVKDYYYPIFSDNWFDVLRATCAIPMLYFRDIEFDGATWVDGGVTATIPVQESYRRGVKDMVVITTAQVIKEPQPESSAITQLRNSIDLDVDQLVRKYGLVGHRNKLQEFQKQFVDKLAELQASSQSRFDLSNHIPKQWIEDKEKLAQIIDQQAKRLDFSMLKPQKMDMLVSHYMNHTNAIEFMNAPPEEVNIDCIAPKTALATKELLSSRVDILHDYQLGLQAGAEYLASKADN